jgi:hypothetical protein
MPDRPDPLTDALARFTPAARLDRDEVLFQAGRASARAGRLWKGAAALLLATNAATLAVWLSTPPRQVAVIEPPPTPGLGSPAVSPPTETGPAIPSWIVSARRTGELPPLPAGTEDRLVDPKPLTVLSDSSDI